MIRLDPLQAVELRKLLARAGEWERNPVVLDQALAFGPLVVTIEWPDGAVSHTIRQQRQ